MIKRISLLRRKTGISTDEFERYWLSTHRSLALRLPGLRGYRINLARGWTPSMAEPWDGFGETWFDSREAMDEALTLFANELSADRRHFVEEVVSVVVEEHVVMAEGV